MRRPMFALLLPAVLWSASACADYRITRDHGGYLEDYKAKYARIRDRGERVIIDGICNSGCTVVLGIVPLNRVCVTPRASLGFHMAYFDKAATGGVKVMSYAGTDDHHGGIAPEMKRVKNGPELWAIVDPCPEEFF
jgi:hypothetical protein